MKIEVLQLLSAVCMYSSDGHKLVTNALNYLKVCEICHCVLWLLLLQNEKQTRFKYSLLIEELHGAETDEYRGIIVAFINCLLAGCGNIEERSNIRHDLTGVQQHTKPSAVIGLCVPVALNYQHLLADMK